MSKESNQKVMVGLTGAEFLEAMRELGANPKLVKQITLASCAKVWDRRKTEDFPSGDEDTVDTSLRAYAVWLKANPDKCGCKELEHLKPFVDLIPNIPRAEMTWEAVAKLRAENDARRKSLFLRKSRRLFLCL